MKLYRNASLYINGAFTEPSFITTDRGRILTIGKDIPGADEVYDLGGDYLLPGFVDVHIHGFHGCDTMRGESDVREMSRELAKIGVAAFLPTTMSASPEDTQKALAGIGAVIEKPETNGAVVYGAHMEAPFLSEMKAGAQRKEFFAEPNIVNWKAYVGKYEKIVRIVTLAPEKTEAMEFIQFLCDKGITVSLGHTAADAETVHLAANAGATHVTHTFNAMTPLQSRVPGVSGAALTDPRLLCEIIGDGYHLHPDIVHLVFNCKGASGVVAITDAMEAAGMPDGCYDLGGLKVFSKDGTARLADGTLAGSTLTMGKALLNMIKFGIPVETAVAAVTSTPALSVGLKGFGILRTGAFAGFVRLSRSLDEVTSI